jgi:hypothetical protein
MAFNQLNDEEEEGEFDFTDIIEFRGTQPWTRQLIKVSFFKESLSKLCNFSLKTIELRTSTVNSRMNPFKTSISLTWTEPQLKTVEQFG